MGRGFGPPEVPVRLSILYLMALITLGLDQWVKHWVVQHLTLHVPGEPFVTLPGTAYGLALTYTQNFGSAWSMFWGQRAFLIAIAATVSLGIVVYSARLPRRDWTQMLGLGFLLGGALGNLIDRARLGFVVDMFDLQRSHLNVFPIFNVADIGIDVGVVLLLLHATLLGREEARLEAEAARLAASPAAPGGLAQPGGGGL
jgi:signal peptidase II